MRTAAIIVGLVVSALCVFALALNMAPTLPAWLPYLLLAACFALFFEKPSPSG